MNKVYKVLFNKSTGKYVVVSENSKSAKKSSKTIQSIVLAAVAFGGTSITMAAELALGGGTATGTDTIAIGERSNASGILSIALGADSVVQGINSAAIGPGAQVLGNDSVAIGTRAKALADYSTALGNQATAETAYDFAAGYNASASGGQSMALGFAAKSKGVASTAIGSSSLAEGDYSIAIGQESKTAADQNFATALGYKSNASGWASFAQGSFALASGDGSISIGDSSSATGKNSIAIGGASGANLDNSVALGSRSRTSTNAVTVTSATVGDITYGGFTGAVSSVGSQISVGNTGNERQIKHVAAGTISQTSTDAINGSQLFSTQKALGNLASSTSSALGGGSNVQPDGSLSLPTYVITNNPMSPGSTVTVNNVGDALTALDQAVNTGLVFNGNTGNNITKKLGDTLSIKGDLANADAATATNLRVDEENGELKIKLARNLTDLDSVTVGNTVLNPNGLTVGGPTGPSITTNGINAGDKAITNVAPGVNGTDAVNVDQLKAQETTLGNKGLNFSANSGPSVHKNLGDSLGVIGTGTKADSEYSGENVKTITDANGNIVVQLDKNLTADSLTINGKPGVNGQPGTPGLSITGAQGPAGVNGQPGEVTTRIEYNDGTGPKQVANLNDGLKFAGNQGSTINKKLNETLSIKGDLANADAATATNLRVDEENGELKIKLARNLTDLDSVTVGNTVLNPNGLTVGGPTGPSITTNGINAGDKAITNVAPGVNGTDAVNVDQLKAQETTLGNKGLNFSANSGPSVHKNLGDSLGVIGTGTKADSEYSGENVKTITDANGNIVVQLDKNLTADSLTINGKPGVNGQPGTPGLSITGAQGPAGVNGQPGEVTTRIEYNDGTGPQQVANLNDGLKFAGNQGSTINKKLNETLSIKGDLANADAATATNLRVDEENGELKIKLARNLTDLDSVTVGNTVLNPNGLTVGGPTGPSITTNGINAGDKAITNVAPGVNGTDAVNVDQLKAQETTLGNKGLNFSANSGPSVHKNLGDSLGVIGTGTKADSEYSGENVKTITDANGNIVVQLDKNLTADSLTINGKPGVNGQPGTPGLSITGAQGPAGVNGQPGEVTTRIEYNDGTGPQQVANLNDGLKFAGNQGSTINKKLNETLSIKGDLANADAATATNLRVDEENGELKIKLARNLTDLDSVTVGNTVLNPNGLTVGGPTGPSITTNGINAGDKAITNVAPGVNGTDAVNVDQLKAQETTLGNKGLNFSANSGPSVHKNLGDSLGVIGTGTKADSEYSGENVKTITDANGNIVVQLDKNLTADSLTINGKPGVNGQPGTPGLSITGAQGPAGVNGQPGEVTTRIEYNDGTGPQQVANLNDGLKFAGNQGSTINKKLNETLSIKGDLANADAATATNLRVDEENGELKIKLARNLTDLDSVTVGNTVLNPNGLTVGGPTGPSITTNGINAGDKAITNVAPGVNGTDAVNVDQLKAQETTLGNKGLNFSANSGAAVHKNLGDTLGVIGTGTKADSEYSGENVKTITDANGNIVVQLDKNLTADSLTINGKPGVNGQPGTPGLSITGAQGPAGVNGQPGEVTTRIEYNDGTGPQQVANLNDGLKFAGNQGSTINKKLNETLSIKGDLANADAATATNLRVDEENGELKIKLARNLTDLDSVTVGNTVLNPNGLTVGGPTGPSITTNGINAGDKAITNVAPGVNGTDAVNVDQLTKQTAVATTEVKAADGDKNISVDKVTAKDGHSIYNVGVSRDLNVDTVTLPNIDGSSTKLSANGLSFVDIAGNPTGPMVTANGIDAGNQKITNVAPAIISKESKDAVNGSQLYNLGNNINNIFGGNASYNGDIINWTNIGGTGHNNIDDAIKSIGDQATNANKGWNIATDNGVTSNVKPNDTVNINGDKKSGIIISNVDNNITVGLADKVNIGDKIKIDGTTGEINAGQIKIDGNKGTVNNLTNTTWNGPDQITSGQAATEDQLAQAVKNVTNQTTAAKTEVTQGENIVVTSSKASDGHTIYNVETAKDVKFNSVKSDVVQVGNVQIDKDGINAGKQKVTNVEAGTISKESKDAVNGSQLYQSNQNIANYLGGGSNIDTNGNTTAPTYNVNGGTYNNVGDALGAIDNRVTNVQNNLEQAFNYTNKRIDDVENNANAGTAQALATAGLPQAYIPGKSMMAISGGTFRGESGYAIGFSSISDNGRWVIKATGSGNSRGDFGGTVGGGIQW